MVATLESGLSADLSKYLNSDVGAIQDPYPLFSRLRTESPVYYHAPSPAFFVTSHEDVKLIVQDMEGMSNHGYSSGTRAEAVRARLDPDDQRRFDEVADFELRQMSRSDDDQHERLRRIAHRMFTKRRIAVLDASIQEFTEQIFDEVDQAIAREGSADLMSLLARNLPVMVITELLNVPQSDRHLIQGWADAIAANRGGTDPEALRRAHSAIVEFGHYLQGALQHMEASVSENTDKELLRTLLDARDGERLSEDELVSMFNQLLIAGSETTTNLLASGIDALLRNPDQWQLIVDARISVEQAVDELLRYVSPVQYIPKVSRRMVDMKGAKIAPGQTILVCLAAANRDPAVFDNPDRLDLMRTHNPHLAFSIGGHYCLGAAMAKQEAVVALRTLAARHPNVRLGGSAPTYAGNAQLRHLSHVTVRW